MAHHSHPLFQKREKFSIRRLSVGVASVTIGCLLFGQQVAFANEIGSSDASPSSESMEEKPTTPTNAPSSEEVASKLETETEANKPQNETPSAPTAPVKPVTEESKPAETAKEEPSYTKNEHQIGGIKDITVNQNNHQIFDITYTNGYKGQVSLYNDHVVRYQVTTEKQDFQETPEPSSPDRPADIVTKKITDYSAMATAPVLSSDENAFHIKTDKIRIDLRKKDSLMSVTDLVADKVILQEAAPLELTGHTSKQTLRSHEESQYFGGGTQNGRFSHKGQSIRIVNENNWVDKGVASPNPFYWSNNGYGVLRHTFKPGTYDFEEKDPKLVTTTHQDGRFDAYYFINSSFTGILKDYYDLTGKPVVLPIFALYEGHLNAYNRDIWVEVPEKTSGAVYFEELGKWYKEYQPSELGNRKGIKETLTAKPGDANYAFTATAVVDRYKKNDMPLGWMLVNDGYGAGYGQEETLKGNIENLKKFAEDAKKKGVLTGLWTQSDLHPKEGIPALLQRDLDAEVKDGMVRVLKTDVAWVGSGYSFGLNGITDAAKIMTEKGDDARPFIITLDGWAGTQRYAGIWTGDQTGGQWEYIRFHIPTYIGTGLSGNPNVGSDMDGIFGGKNKVVNTRDYQWKTFTPLQLNMDGWGWNPKNPYAMDQTTTDINRTYLKMKAVLVPYSYSLAHEAADGAPIVQAMFLQFPKETINYSKDVQYQFMYGKNFLIAPVYENVQGDADGNDVRNRIYLPSGAKWIDYFTGKSYEGGQMLNNYDAPIWKLPIFVRSGAIIPVTNPHNNYTEIDHTLRQVDFYPDGTTDFDLIEDDGLTNSYLNGKVAKTHITSEVNDGLATLTIHKTENHFDNFQANKASQFNINVSKKPSKVQLLVDDQEVTLTSVDTLEDFQKGHNVYFYDQKPNLNQFSTQGSKLAEIDMTKNPVVRVKSDLLDVTKHTVQVKVSGYELNLPAQTAYKEGNAAAPQLTISDKDNTPTSVNLTWKAVDGASGYELEMDGIRYTNLKDTHFQHRDLAYGSSHHYRVRAIVNDQYTQWSDTSEGHTKDNPLVNAIDNIRITSNRNAQPGTPHKYLVDKDLTTMYHSKWSENSVPEELTLDLRQAYDLDKLEYVPRDNGGNGTIAAATIATSLDGVHWTLAKNVDWEADSSTKTLKFAKGTKARYVSVLATETVGASFVSGLEMLVYKTEGSQGQVLGDVTGDGKVDSNDLTSLKNYAGLRRDIDSDFKGYVQVADLNENGVIDAFDIYYVTRGLGNGKKPANSQATGQLKWTASKTTLSKGDEVDITLTGQDLKAVEGIHAHLPIDKDLYDVVGTVTVRPGFENMRNFSTVRTHGNHETEAFVILTNDKSTPTIEGTQEIATLRLRAKKDHTLSLPTTENYVLGTNMITSLEHQEDLDNENKPEETVKPIPSSRITVTGKDVYQAGQGLDKLIDGNKDTLAELKWDWEPNHVNGKLPKEISLPQDIVFQFDPATPTYLQSMEISKRTPGNGTVTKFQVRSYNGNQVVSDSGVITSPFSEATATINFDKPAYVDKVVLTVLEAQTQADQVNNQMMSLREVRFFEQTDALKVTPVPTTELTVTGKDVYQNKDGVNSGIENLNDGKLDTLTELKWDWEPNHVNGKLPADISLPQDITFNTKDKEVHYLTGLEVFKRTPGNGTVTKYKVTAYQDDKVTYQSTEIESDFKEEKSIHSFRDLIPANKVVVTILEARTSADTINNQMMTLKEIKLYEIAKELIPNPATPEEPEQPATKDSNVVIVKSGEESPSILTQLPKGKENYQASAQLRMEYKGENPHTAAGSATFIGDHVLITAAHNFLKESSDLSKGELIGDAEQNRYTWILPDGRSGQFTAKDIHFWNQAGFPQGFKNDLAVITLPEKAVSQAAQLTPEAKEKGKGEQVSIFGYTDGHFRGVVNDPILESSQWDNGSGNIAYTGTTPGMSGGGIFDTAGHLIGVHQNGVVESRSGGLILSPEQLAWVESLLKEQKVDENKPGENPTPTEQPGKEEQDKPNKPEMPGKEEQDKPNKPEMPGKEEQDKPSKPEIPGKEEQDKPSKPETPGKEEQDKPSKPETPDKTEQDKPSKPETPDKTEQDKPSNPETPDKTEQDKPTNTDKPQIGDQVLPATPSDLQILTDQATGVQVIARRKDLNGAAQLEVMKVARQILNGHTYDAFDIKLKNSQNQEVQPAGMVLVRLPVADKPVAQVFYVTPSNQLEALDFEQKGQTVEFMTNHFSVYAVVYKAEQQVSSTKVKADEMKAETPVATSTSSHKEEKAATLPNTGEKADQLLFITGLTLALTGLGLMKKQED